MKRLVCLISTEGKSKDQIVKETWGAFQNYERVKSQVEKDLKEKLDKDKNDVSGLKISDNNQSKP